MSKILNNDQVISEKFGKLIQPKTILGESGNIEENIDSLEEKHEKPAKV